MRRIWNLDAVISALLTSRILIQFIGQIFALHYLRNHRQDIARPFRMWLYPIPGHHRLHRVGLHLRDVRMGIRGIRPAYAGVRHCRVWYLEAVCAGVGLSAGRMALLQKYKLSVNPNALMCGGFERLPFCAK